MKNSKGISIGKSFYLILLLVAFGTGTFYPNFLEVRKIEYNIESKYIEEAKEIKDRDIAEALDLPPIKIHCSVLAEDAIKKAIEDWETKRKK